MSKKCSVCVGKPYCSCKKARQKDKDPEPRTHYRGKLLHKWSTWTRNRGAERYIKICSRCGRARLKHLD